MTMDQGEAARAFGEFAAVIQALRTPGTGCPWDLEQDHRSLRPYLVEEAYEVLDAIDRGDDPALREELGDLLLQVVLHAQVAADRGAFALTEVVRDITEKMVRRHPHVFGSAQANDADEVRRNWEQIKAAEKRARGESAPADALDRLPAGLPALLRAQRLAEKAARAGLGPPSVAEALDQAQAAFESLAGATRSAAGERGGRFEQPLGDLLFGLCQLARLLGVDAEGSLRDRSRNFANRFRRQQGQAGGDDASAGPASAESL